MLDIVLAFGEVGFMSWGGGTSVQILMRKMVVDKRGQPSQTEWRVLGRDGRITWIEAKPLTGRMHQIRVHLASIGCPILGDWLYGAGTADLLSETLCLHARGVKVPLYHSKPPIEAVAEPPEHMREKLAACGWG